MRHTIAFAVIALMIPVGVANAACSRHQEAKGGFSLCPPGGWKAETGEQAKYTSFFAEAANGFMANINVQDEVANIPLAEYVTIGTKRAVEMAKEAGFKRVDVTTRGDFTTESKERGIRVVYESEFQDREIRSIQYAFSAKGGQKIIVTCTTLLSDKQTLGPVCDSAAKSFKLESR
jgi:hypothetical protein